MSEHEWQPIERAPKDGTAILVIAPSGLRANKHHELTVRATAALEAANARIALAIALNEDASKCIAIERARAERAEARVAELEDTTWPSETVANILARAERAEAHIKELNDKWADDVLRVERAEAECKEMREVLAFYANAQRFATGTEEHRCALQKADAFRAALNPSPADIKRPRPTKPSVS